MPKKEPTESPAKKPKPGEPEFDWAPLYDTDDLYTHTFPDGTVVAIKSFAKIYSKTWLYKIRNLPSEDDVIIAAIDRAASPVARSVLESLDDTGGDPLAELWTAWFRTGTSLGEGDKGLTPGN